MWLITQIFAAVGVLSALVSLIAYFSGWSDFGSLLREVFARFGISPFAARPVIYYDTRMSLSTKDSDIVATFQIPATAVEATFTISTGSRKGILGPSSDPSYGSGFQNAQGTVFGFTSQPATKTGFNYLFFRDGHGQISIIHDVNEKLAAKLPPAWRDFALGFLRIEGILRRTVEFETVDFSRNPRHTLHFLVDVDSHGNLIYKDGLLSSQS
ncbi:MAG: hypothetical protein DME97_13450 [Verrucomicrobia bacterium]|nr:MAG: hypothetical protein DME97_13450 [Verrucomicrobiota bacterium]